jgi:hypothetical protein
LPFRTSSFLLGQQQRATTGPGFCGFIDVVSKFTGYMIGDLFRGGRWSMGTADGGVTWNHLLLLPAAVLKPDEYGSFDNAGLFRNNNTGI